MATTWTSDMTPSTRFWDRIARKYAAHPIKDQAAYEMTLARTLEHLGPESSVLELGCGTGSTALLLAGHVRSYLATDFAPSMIRIAEEKLADQKAAGTAPDGLAFATADVFSEQTEPSDVGRGGYDAILAYNFFHLVENQQDTLARIRALLKPGGLFVSKTVCLADRAWLFGPPIRVMQLFGKAPFVRLMSVRALEEMIGDAGFEIIETGNYPEPRSRFVVARKL